jgi:hypothetical protein
MATDITQLKCFVIASPQDHRFEQLYQEIYDAAIRDAQLIPCRTTFDAEAKLPLEAIAQDIGICDVCFADLSQGSSYLWFAIACALALGKPLCLVSSRNAEEEAPFELPRTDIMQYPLHSLPSDYRRLRSGIMSRLELAVSSKSVARAEGTDEVEAKVAETIASIIPQMPETGESVDEAPAVEVAAQTKEVSIGTEIVPLKLTAGDVRVHELLALTIILKEQGMEGMTLRELALEMNKHGVAQATSLSIRGLCRKGLVERRLMSLSNGQQNFDEERLFLSEAGEAWIEAYRESVDLSFTAPPPDAEPLGLMEYIASM